MDDTTSRTGQTVAGFTLTERIARGHLASVYRAERGGERAAVKIYEAALDAHRAERIERERDMQRRIAHPCVAPLLDAGLLADGAPFLVSGWIDGRPLEARLAAGPMTWLELAPILRAVGRGLQAIHAAGIVHRDLKPSNIVLSPGETAVVLDFGHALALGERRLTADDHVLGSASYTAPEQAAGAPLDGRVDLYALGVIAYRALCGVLPFADASAAEVLRRHMVEPVIAPRVRAPARQIPAAAEDLCLWLLAKEPAARLPNARVLAITLEAMRAGEPGSEEKVA